MHNFCISCFLDSSAMSLIQYNNVNVVLGDAKTVNLFHFKKLQ
jgi:hypothetical protein